MTRTYRAMAVSLVATLLLVIAGVAAAKPSNKWRLEFSGDAKSNGEIVVRLTPEGGAPIEVTTAVADGTSENNVAKTVVNAMKTQLSEDAYHVERDDGEDVLIKKRHGQPDFDVEIVSNSVEHVRINTNRE